jgi:hypothetical protein
MSPDHHLEGSANAGRPVEVQVASHAPSPPHWYALSRRSHCEQLVADQLAAKGFQVFLPTLERWSQRAGWCPFWGAVGPAGAIPEAEIEAIHKAVVARFPLFPHPYLKEGQRVPITHGPLGGMGGILVRSKPAKALLVLSVKLLQRRIAVQIPHSMTCRCYCAPGLDCRRRS